MQALRLSWFYRLHPAVDGTFSKCPQVCLTSDCVQVWKSRVWHLDPPPGKGDANTDNENLAPSFSIWSPCFTGSEHLLLGWVHREARNHPSDC